MNAAQLPETVPELLAWRADTTPQDTACHHKASDAPGQWVPTTWRELDAEVCRAARGLRDRGLGLGDGLAILARTRREWLVSEMAGLRAGAVVVGIDPHAPTEQAAFILRHSEARFLIVDAAWHVEQLPSDVRAQLAAVVVLDGDAGRFTSWRELSNPRHDPIEGPGPAPGDFATLVYTAGTTGTPKGVGYTHAQLMTACRAAVEVFPEITLGDTTLCWLPMAHLFQRMLNLWAIARGMTFYVAEDPRAILDTLRDVKPSFVAAVPRLYEKLAQAIQSAPDPAAEARRLTGGNIKFMLTGSAPLARWVLEFLHSAGLLVLEAYGVTENAVPMAANRVTAHRFGSVGLPFAGNEIRFADDGEIEVRGPGVFAGYYKDERSRDAFTPDGFYRTGDIGHADADGFLYLVGRKSDIIKTSTGRRIAPAAVEAVYGQSPHFDQVIVFGHGRPHLVALIALKQGAVPGAGPEDAAARGLAQRELERLASALAPHEQVRNFALLPGPLTVGAGELTPTLKVRRAKVADRYAGLIERLYNE